MIESDYILRIFNQLVAALARALFYKKAYNFPQARRELQGAYKSLLGMTPEFVRPFTIEQLLGMFGKDEETVIAKCYVLGSLLKEECDIALMEGNETGSSELGERALTLLLTSFVMAENEIETGHAARIDELTGRNSVNHEALDVLEKLVRYNELTGRYAKAEDFLVDLVEIDSQYAEMGHRFYERLLKRSSDELRAGGLPRYEVLDGIQKLKELQS